MKVCDSIGTARQILEEAKKAGKTIGFVPTMGALHEGHLSLVKQSRKQADFTAVSIFVNPAQFGEGEDLDKYPRTIAKDSKLLEEHGVDLLFLPTERTMYPEGFDSWVTPAQVASPLEGKRRPGHFKGVCTVVLKLFNIVQPDYAFFGQKDAQQFAVLEKMIIDLDLPLKMVRCPIVRESDGLAMSSRNRYLSPEERKAALIFYKALKRAEAHVLEHDMEINEIKKIITSYVETEPLARLDYFEIVKPDDFSVIEIASGQVYILIAGYIGQTRLIDNLLVEIKRNGAR